MYIQDLTQHDFILWLLDASTFIIEESVDKCHLIDL